MKPEFLGTPTLIVVTGRPGSGKTTLSHRLAQAIRCPLISRDEIKEGLVNTVQSSHVSSDTDLNGHVYTTFFETIEFLLNRRITLIGEAAFQHKLWIPKLEPLRKIAQVKIIQCSVSSTLAQSRFIQRGTDDPTRANFHDDWGNTGGDLLTRTYEPPDLDVPTLEVDTSDDYQPTFEDIVTFVNDSVVGKDNQL